MSRSYHKNLFKKEKNKRYMKRYSNKVFRKRSIELTDIKPNRLVDSYDISDYRYIADDTQENRRK